MARQPSRPARVRDYRREYAARIARAEREGLSRSAARGHARTGERSAREAASSGFVVTAPLQRPDGSVGITTADVDRRTAVRVGRYDELTRRLGRGEISPKDFKRRVGRWAPLPDGSRFVSDPTVAAAIVAATPAAAWRFESGRQRPRRARAAG